jgi:hypothetical protein
MGHKQCKPKSIENSETLINRKNGCCDKPNGRRNRNCGFGSDCFISLYDDVQQEISVGEAVDFNYYQNKKNVVFNPLVDKTRIQVLRGGYFYIHLQMDTNMPCQFTLFVNDVPNLTTTDGSNTGAVQFASTGLIQLKRGDVLKWINYTSAQGVIVKTLNAGGLSPSVNAQFVLFKLADDEPEPLQCCHSGRYNACLEKFAGKAVVTPIVEAVAK